MLCVLGPGRPIVAQVINAGDFGLKEGLDATPAIRLALEACLEVGASKLVIPEGTYLLYPDRAVEKYVHISNNDDGLKRIAFPLHGLDDFEVDANGSLFIMHGEMVTFDVQECENIRLKNFSIDWNKPFYFQGQVVAVHEELNAFDLKVHDECDYEIVANELVFLEKPGKAVRTWSDWAMHMKQDLGWEQNLDWNIWYDPSTMAAAYNGWPLTLRSYNEETGKRYRVEEVENGLLRIFDATPKLPPVDWVLVIKGKKSLNRTSPAIHVFNSKDFLIENVTIHHAGGMGFIAERSENITMENLQVRVPENSSRMVTTTADATHFVNCRGLVYFNNCFFESMLDDATNVHGIYTRVNEIIDDYTIGVKRVHGQQLGFLFATPGDSIRISDMNNLEPYAKREVKSVLYPNSEFIEITFTEKIADDLKPNSVADNLTWQADLHMQNTTVRRNRARSMLISTGGDALIENNRFLSCTFTSILFEGDGTFWHESGPVRNVVIRNNYFEDFGLARTGAPILQCSPRVIHEGEPTHYYHKNIHFENNTCKVFGRTLVRLHSVENFTFSGNRILTSENYPLDPSKSPAFSITESNNILIQNNEYLWDEPATVEVDEWTENVKVSKNKGFEKFKK